MSISLEKSQKISLDKVAPNLKNITLGLGWNPQDASGEDFDLDVSVFMLDANGKLTNDKNLVFYNNKKSPCGSIQHGGDNLTGQGDGDDETVRIALDQVPADVNSLEIIVNIFRADERGQKFGQVKQAYVRMIDDADNTEKLRYDLGEDYSTETAVMFGRLYRHNGEWKFEATGLGEKAGLDTYIARFTA